MVSYKSKFCPSNTRKEPGLHCFYQMFINNYKPDKQELGRLSFSREITEKGHFTF